MLSRCHESRLRASGIVSSLMLILSCCGLEADTIVSVADGSSLKNTFISVPTVFELVGSSFKKAFISGVVLV